MHERFRAVRTSLGLSMRELGERMGVSRDVINNLERGRVQPDDRTIKLFCMTFRVNEDWLRNGGDPSQMFVEPDTDPADEAIKAYKLTEREGLLVKRFLLLPKEVRAGLLDFIEAVAADLSGPGKDGQSADGGLDLHAELDRVQQLEKRGSQASGASDSSTA